MKINVQYKFEVFVDSKGMFRFRFKSKNNKIMFQSEGYSSRGNAMRAIRQIRDNVEASRTVFIENIED